MVGGCATQKKQIMPRLLELFSGTGSIRQVFEALNWQVTSLDIDDKFMPDICCDILEWNETVYPPGYFDMIWASPVCTEYSRALSRRPRNLEAGDRLAMRALDIIRYFQPRWWAMENPQTGLLKTRPFMQGLLYSDVTYCKYGYRYKKATRIWHNLPWRPSQDVCCKDSPCVHMENGRHPESAQRGSTNGKRNCQTQEQLYSIPERLCAEIAFSLERFTTE